MTSLPDVSELPGLGLDGWRRWFVDAAGAAMDSVDPTTASPSSSRATSATRRVDRQGRAGRRRRRERGHEPAVSQDRLPPAAGHRHLRARQLCAPARLRARAAAAATRHAPTCCPTAASCPGAKAMGVNACRRGLPARARRDRHAHGASIRSAAGARCWQWPTPSGSTPSASITRRACAGARARCSSIWRASAPAEAPTRGRLTLPPPAVAAPRCRRPEVVCYCAQLPRLPTRTHVLVLQHPRERTRRHRHRAHGAAGAAQLGPARGHRLCRRSGGDRRRSPAARRAICCSPAPEARDVRELAPVGADHAGGGRRHLVAGAHAGAA